MCFEAFDSMPTMNAWFATLLSTVAAQSQDPLTLTAGKGRVLVTLHGARVLGVDLPGLTQNPFFTVHSSGRLTGGDRLWIAPEVAFFWLSLDDARRDPKGTTSVQPGIDPAYWVREISSDGRALSSASMSLHDVRSDKQIELHVKRQVDGLDDALQVEDDLEVASFRIENSVTITGGDQGAVAGAWDLLMVPPTGTLTVPTRERTVPTSYYDPFGDRHVKADDDAVRFLIDGKRRIKMGIQAAASTGVMGYYREQGDGTAVLIVRSFEPQPNEPYCDVPRDAPADTTTGGDAVQAYNDEGDSFGDSIGSSVTFGEMEHHDPCVIVGQGPQSRRNACTTHVLVGPTESILDAGQRLLGLAVAPLI